MNTIVTTPIETEKIHIQQGRSYFFTEWTKAKAYQRDSNGWFVRHAIVWPWGYEVPEIVTMSYRYCLETGLPFEHDSHDEARSYEEGSIHQKYDIGKKSLGFTS